MPGLHNNRFNKEHKRIALEGGDNFDLYRVNYGSVDNEPMLIKENLLVRADPVSPKFAEPSFVGMNHYDIFCDRSLIQSGDILKKDDDFSPVITISTIFPMKTISGFRSSRLGKITKGTSASSDVVYDNVYFEFTNDGSPVGFINPGLGDSERIPANQIVLYARTNLINVENMILTEMDLLIPGKSYGKRWRIEQATYAKPIMTLYLRSAV